MQVTRDETKEKEKQILKCRTIVYRATKMALFNKAHVVYICRVFRRLHVYASKPVGGNASKTLVRKPCPRSQPYIGSTSLGPGTHSIQLSMATL